MSEPGTETTQQKKKKNWALIIILLFLAVPEAYGLFTVITKGSCAKSPSPSAQQVKP